MATVGSIALYSPEDDWPQHVEQLKFYLQANGMESEEKKRATFLTVVEPATFKLLRSTYRRVLCGTRRRADKALQSSTIGDSTAIQVSQQIQAAR